MRDIIGIKNTCMEQDCSITVGGKIFHADGSFIGINKKTGKHGGVVYAYEKEAMVGNWHGDIKVKARFGKTWRSNMKDYRQSVYFSWRGISFYGIYYKSCGELVVAREIKKRR